MLLSKGIVTKDLVNMLLSWRHSGFNVFCGPRIQPGDQQAMENLARYIIRASFSQERMTYIPEESKVNYQSKDGKEEKVFDALEWLAAMCSHVPNKGESFDLEALDRQMVRYYGYYSNVSRGKRQKEDQDTLIPSILEPDGSSKARPGATHILIYARLRTISNMSFCVYTSGDRSGPGSIERTGQD